MRAALGSFGTPLPKNSVYLVPVLRRVTSLCWLSRRSTLNLTCCPSTTRTGVEQQVAVPMLDTGGASAVKSRLGPGPPASIERSTLPLSLTLNAITSVLSSDLPQLPTAVTLPSGSTTAMLSQLVMYSVRSGCSRGVVPSNVFLETFNCTVSPMCSVVIGAETSRSETQRRRHRTIATITPKTALHST